MCRPHTGPAWEPSVNVILPRTDGRACKHTACALPSEVTQRIDATTACDCSDAPSPGACGRMLELLPPCSSAWHPAPSEWQPTTPLFQRSARVARRQAAAIRSACTTVTKAGQSCGISRGRDLFRRIIDRLEVLWRPSKVREHFTRLEFAVTNLCDEARAELSCPFCFGMTRLRILYCSICFQMSDWRRQPH